MAADVRAVSVKDSLSILLRAQYLAAAISAGALPRRADQHQLGAHAWFAVQAAEKLTSCPLRTEHVQCHMLSVLRDDRACSLGF